MKILDIDQGSEAWKALRSSKIGASDCSGILGKSRYSSPRKVWKDKMGINPEQENEAINRGKELEPEARKFFSNKLMTYFQPLVVQSDDRDWQIASLDGWNGLEVLEIKCPQEKAFEEALTGLVNEDYLWQVQHQLSVTGAKTAILGFYRPENPRTHVMLRFGRDEAMIAELNATEEAFYREYMLEFREPPTKRAPKKV
jgi:putative phage-type endonuclease